MVMRTRFFWAGILLALVMGLFIAGCAEFLEDYQYNPAGSLMMDRNQ